MIRFEGVHKWFDKLHVLNDVNLHVRSGEVVVVCGPSGSGNRPSSGRSTTSSRSTREADRRREGHRGQEDRHHRLRRRSASSSSSSTSTPTLRPQNITLAP